MRTRTGDEPFLADPREQHALDMHELRAKMAAIVKIVLTLLAAVLALGALCVAAGKYVSAHNWLVSLIFHLADAFDGPFSRVDGVFTFSGANGPRLDGVVNWGFGAVIYMVLGNVLRTLLRPKGPSSRKKQGD